MKLRYIMILSIIIKIIIGMSGVIFFLRISGKTQMAQLTPLDSVNAFVLGALIGGVIYNPDLSVWYMIFALGTWTIVNMTIRYLLHNLCSGSLFYYLFLHNLLSHHIK